LLKTLLAACSYSNNTYNASIMTIYIDVSAAVHRRAGLGRYAENLTRALIPRLTHKLALFYNREKGVTLPPGLEHLPSRTVALSYKSWRMLVWAGQLARIPFNRLTPDAALFHAAEHLLLPLKDVPTVLTVHDLIFRYMPEHHKPLNRWYLNLTMPLYCRRADHIIAVSEATRHDIINAYHIPPEKISVIYEAADPRFEPQLRTVVEAMRARYHLPEQYLLYVGTIEPRKNLTRLLKVWESLYQAHEVPPLVIVGQQGWLTGDFFEALENSPAREGVLLTGYIEDSDLPALYSGATAMVFPSLYEGFGLPPLEAMACGTPVLCSNVSSLPEVVEDVALTFDPTDDEAMAQALRRIVRDKALHDTLKEQGLCQAARFSWGRAAQETKRVYEQVLSACRATS
jgi:glycosyltransferase involved in cell wall biosynthesis